MQKSYTHNYLKIYFWQGCSIVLNLLSVFIVIPRLADRPEIYGIYVVCVSAGIFLAYADLGFVSAGTKHVSECFSRKNLNEEIEITGFVCFVIFVFVLLFSIVVLGIAIRPSILVSKISNPQELAVATHLFLILAIFSPSVVGQRFLEITYGARIEQYIYQRVLIIASAFKIASVLYFFHNPRHDIVGYFLFCQIVNLLAIAFSARIVGSRYGYNYKLFWKSFRFSKAVFERTRKLAYASLFLTCAFVLYYELDAFVIVKTFGPDKVAIYSIGFAILTFLRNIYGVIYSPFLSRYNHFIGLRNIEGLKDFHQNVIIVTMPLICFPIISLIVLMKPMVNSWVGEAYQDSVLIAQFLIAGFLFMFVSNPSNFLMVSQERIRWLYVTSAVQPVIYWVGVLLTIPFLGLRSFAILKFFTFLTNAIINMAFTLRFLETSTWDFLIKIFKPMIVPILFLIALLIMVQPLLPLEKEKVNLGLTIFVGGFLSLCSLLLYACFSKLFRDNIGYAFNAMRSRPSESS